MKNTLPTWMTPWIALRFTAGLHHAMDVLSFGSGNLSDRITRNKLQVLGPSYDVFAFEDEPMEPTLPTPTDVPVPEPHDVPVPEPIDVPPPEPRDVPPPKQRMPEFDPRPRSIP